MRFVWIFTIVLTFACQSAVRYSAVDDSDYDTGNSASDNAAINAEGQVDQARMGKIIAGFLRTPYKEGGRDKYGIDCSGLTYSVYRKYNGTVLPRTVAGQYDKLTPVDMNDLTYGDLVFFKLNGNRISHVGIYIKNMKFVHAAKSEGVVVSSLKEKYYRKSYKGARRVFQ
jgi:cell wall-associated NlpC family hydrolase